MDKQRCRVCEKMKKFRIVGDSIYFIGRWMYYCVLLPAVPILVVWGLGNSLLGSVDWNDFDFFGDFIIITSGVFVSALEFVTAKTANSTNKWKNVPITIIRLAYISCSFWFYGLYAREGIRNPYMKKFILENIDKLMMVRNIYLVVLGVVLLIVIVFGVCSLIKEGRIVENES